MDERTTLRVSQTYSMLFLNDNENWKLFFGGKKNGFAFKWKQLKQQGGEKYCIKDYYSRQCHLHCNRCASGH